MIRIELSLDEWRTLQNALGFIQAFRKLSISFCKNSNVDELHQKITEQIGDKVDMIEREKTEQNIRNLWQGHPRILKRVLKEFAEEYPLPPALRDTN